MWAPDPARLGGVGVWCAARGIPDALIAGGDRADLRAAARAAGYRRGVAFEFEPFAPSTTCNDDRNDGGPRVEQVGFAHSAPAGLLLARRYRQPQNAVPIGRALADALRRDPALALWLAYREGEVVGALVAHRSAGEAGAAARWSGLLEAGAPPVLAALRARLRRVAESEDARAALWRGRGGHGALPARGVVRFERDPTRSAESGGGPPGSM